MRTGIFTLFLLALFLIGGAVFSRQAQTVLAREVIDPLLQCSGPEIPVGKVRDETDKFSQEIVRLMLELAQDAKAERSAAKKLMATSDECKIDRCISSCVWETSFSTTTTCDGGVCTDTREEERFCATEPDRGCGEDACPKQDVEDRLKSVKEAYVQLQATRNALSNLLREPRPSPFVITGYCGSDQCKKDYGTAGCSKKCQNRTWRDHILLNLEEARNGLQECVTPANFYDTAESNQKVNIPMTCQEARLNGVLSEEQAARCFNNNFFCCTIKPTQ